MGRAAMVLALTQRVAVRAWRWLRSSGWNENIEAVYGPSDGLTSGERITCTGVTFLGGGEGGPPTA
jgi:hypothetical protein